MKRVSKGQPDGGQFAPDTRGRTAPSAGDLPARPSATDPSPLPPEALFTVFTDLRTSYTDETIPLLPADGEPTRVLMFRGLPGSGKSTFARAILQAYPAGTVARINNDDLSTMMFGSMHPDGMENAAGLLSDLRIGMLRALLKNPTVRLVLVDNTNLVTKTVNSLASAARAAGADPVVDDRFLAVPLEECLRRNAMRDIPVPEQVIRGMHKQAARLQPWTSPVTPVIAPYDNNPDLPPVVLVDIDGTLARMSPDRSPFDWRKVGLDTPNPAVVNVVQTFLAQGRHVVVMSGRDQSCEQETRAWLDKHVAVGLPLHMRPAGDNRPDNLVKYDLFSEHIAGKHSVDLVMDDRDQVVNLWRRQLCLPTFQVADGDF
jgi:predicted kinase